MYGIAQLIRQRLSFAVDAVLGIAYEDEDALNKAPNAADTAGDNVDDDLNNGTLGLAKVEVVYAVGTQKDAEKTGGQLGLGALAKACVSLDQRTSAIDAHSLTRLNGSATLSAIMLTGADGKAALSANGRALYTLIAAILTKHDESLLYSDDSI